MIRGRLRKISLKKYKRTEILTAANFIRQAVVNANIPYQDTFFPRGLINPLTWSTTLETTT